MKVNTLPVRVSTGEGRQIKQCHIYYKRETISILTVNEKALYRPAG